MINEGLITSLNAIREMSVAEGKVYHQYIPVIDQNTNIATIGEPVLNYPQVANDFMNMLVNKLVYTQFLTKLYNNPLKVLEGERMPLGYCGEEIYTNPAKGRQYNVNDFAGLLQRYEADTKVQYFTLNSDLQYPVNVTRHDLKKAFTSWADLDRFIDQLSNSLYNGAFIKDYRMTKNLVSSAYNYGGVKVETVSAVSDEATAKTFLKVARNAYLGFQAPSTEFNAWAQAGGYGDPITTWTNPDDIVILIRYDVLTAVNIDSLSSAFNIDRADLMGRVITVDNFDVIGDNGQKLFNGQNILALIADKAWFRIKESDLYLDQFYNPNNRMWTYYLNSTKMFQYSLFANALCIATAMPTIAITDLAFDSDLIEGAVGTAINVPVKATPFAGTTTITYASSDTDVFTVAADSNNPRVAVVTPVAAGTAVLTATAGNVVSTVAINIKSA